MLMKKQKITIMLSYFRMWFHLSFSYFQMCACGIVAQGLAVERRGFLIPGPWVHGCKSFGVGGGGGGGGWGGGGGGGGGGRSLNFLEICNIIYNKLRLLTDSRARAPFFLEWTFPHARWAVLVAVLQTRLDSYCGSPYVVGVL
jgi:hypothetical protein